MTKLFMRKNHSKKRISLRYCAGRNVDIVLATPFTIDPNDWDPNKECFDISKRKKYPKTNVDRAYNDLIDEFNLKIEEFKVNLKDFSSNKKTWIQSLCNRFLGPTMVKKKYQKRLPKQ